MFGFIYLIYDIYTDEVIDVFTSEDDCIAVFNEFFCESGAFDWVAVNIDFWPILLKNYCTFN